MDFSGMLRIQYSSSIILERFSDYLEVGYMYVNINCAYLY